MISKYYPENGGLILADATKVESWRWDVVLGSLIFIALMLLRPFIPDGDGLYYASLAISNGLFDPNGMVPRHPMYVAMLKAVYSSLDAIGFGKYAIATLSVTSHLAAVGIFLLLARVVFPLFIRNRVVVYSCAMGAVVSYGIMSRASTIESYSLALLMAVAVVAVCLKGDLSKPFTVVAVGVLFCIAVGFHVTNILLGPFVLALLLWRSGWDRAWFTIGRFGGTVALGIAALFTMLLIAKNASLWPPDLGVIFPTSDPQPSLSLLGRLGRGLYGFLRSIAWIEPYSHVAMSFVAGYVMAMLAAILLIVYLAWHGIFRRIASYQLVILMLSLMALPYLAIGISYFPSDPERWLFMLPGVWLLMGLVWDHYNPPVGAALNRRRSVILLISLVLALGVYNALWKLLPETRGNRELSGLQELTKLTSSKDLVISPGGLAPLKKEVYEPFLQHPLDFENLTFFLLVHTHRGDPLALQADLRSRIMYELRTGRRVYVHNVINEDHLNTRDHPWNFFVADKIIPETFLEVFREFDPTVVVAPSPSRTGTFTLRLKGGDKLSAMRLTS